MINVPNPSMEVERARAISLKVLEADHLEDDNDLLLALRTVGYLQDATLQGHLPAVLFTYGEQAELFVDRPIGVKALTQNGGAGNYYESVHRHMHDLHNYFGFPGARESGHVVEQRDGRRLFLPEDFVGIQSKIDQERVDGEAIQAECGRLGLVGLVDVHTYVANGMAAAGTLTSTMREAAQWLELLYRPPVKNFRADEYYPRPLTVDEAHACLKRVLNGLAKNQTESVSTTITEVVGDMLT